MLFNKSWEFWVALVGAAIYVASRDAEKAPVVRRLAKIVASGAMGYALADDVSPFLRGSDSLAAVVIMVFGVIVLDILSAVLADRDFINQVIRRRLGGKEGDDV